MGVYNAEWRVQNVLATPDVPFKMHGTTVTIPVERKFGHVNTIQIYVDWVCEQEGATAPKVRVEPRMTKKAYYRLGEIVMPNFDAARWAWSECTVLHELAHHLSDGSGHGPAFQKTFTHLLDTYIGAEVGWIYSVLSNGG